MVGGEATVVESDSASVTDNALGASFPCPKALQRTQAKGIFLIVALFIFLLMSRRREPGQEKQKPLESGIIAAFHGHDARIPAANAVLSGAFV